MSRALARHSYFTYIVLIFFRDQMEFMSLDVCRNSKLGGYQKDIQDMTHIILSDINSIKGD